MIAPVRMPGIYGCSAPTRWSGCGVPTGEQVALADLDVAPPGRGTASPHPRPTCCTRPARPARRSPRRLTFAIGMGAGMAAGMRFAIDGKQFDPDRIDQVVTARTAEEWTVVNASPMERPLHLHVWPMQIITRARQTAHRTRRAGRRERPRPQRRHPSHRLRPLHRPNRLPLPYPRPRRPRHHGHHRSALTEWNLPWR
jgi:Multicopper oxidase